jgi:hypothetical protein
MRLVLLDADDDHALVDDGIDDASFHVDDDSGDLGNFGRSSLLDGGARGERDVRWRGGRTVVLHRRGDELRSRSV